MATKHIDHTINFNITGYEIEHVMTVESSVVKFLDDYWYLSIWAAIAYVFLIFGGKKVMERYDKFGLTKSLALWNAMLAVFSIIGAIRMIPNLYYAVTVQSFHDSVCSDEWTRLPVITLWTALFSISKIVELGDTVFIVLRKQPLILLHWYHHITVLIYTWYSLADRTSSGRWYIAMNYSVHSVMYAYYGMRALRYRAPQIVRMAITIFQLSQMVVGVYIATYVYKLKQAGTACGITDNNMKLSFLMYFSYFLLFLKFFYEAYVKPSPRKTTAAKTSNGSLISNGGTKISNGTNGHISNGTNGHISNGANGHISNGANGHISNGHVSAANGRITRSQSKKVD